MGYKKKTWKEKLENNKNFPKVLYFKNSFPCAKALLKLGAKNGDSVVLAPPMDVYEIMKSIPEGKLITLNRICEILSKKYNTKFCCPLTTGIFVTIVANASVETGDNVPYFRTIKNNGELNGKFLSGLEGHKTLLEKENHKIIKKGKKYFVLNFENYLV
ncbi:MAG: hypothetical protein ACPLWB_01375 [Caldisericia bacterium]